jgi:hypothetical protein
MQERRKRVEPTMLAIKVALVNILAVPLCSFSCAVVLSFCTRASSIDVINSS